MGWAAEHIRKLIAGQTVTFRPRGNSMVPHIRNGERVTVAPAYAVPRAGDIVLAVVRGAEYLHFVKAVRADQVLIANAAGHENGWVSIGRVYGILTSTESRGARASSLTPAPVVPK